MTQRFDEVFTRVVGEEGNYNIDPQDPGGETKFGISKRSYPNLNIAGLTLEAAKAIYSTDFWQPLGCDDIGAPLDEFLFDYGVNSGIDHAARALQRAVGALPDGKIGPVTIAAVKNHSTMEILRLLFVDRAMTFATSPILQHEGHGWFGRLFDKTQLAVKGL